MKKIVSLVLSVLMAVTLLCGCAKNQSASPSPFVGTWVCDYDPTGFPAQMVLREDGSAIADGISCVWSTKEAEKEFRLVGGYNDIRYTYIFDGNDTLHLISSDTPSRSSRDVLYERIG